MQLTWSGLVFVLVAAVIAWFWTTSLRVRDAANLAAMEACKQLGLQFLDGTAAFTRLSLARTDGTLKLRRSYVFDYTAHSVERLQGFVVLLGERVESVGFARDERSRAAAVFSQPAPTPTLNSLPADLNNQPQDDSAKVLDLDEWRRARQRP